jgi:hypothetical protein
MIRFLTGLSLGNVLTGVMGALLLGSVLTNCATDRKLQAERLAHQTTKTQHADQVAAAEKQRADEEAKRRKAEKELTDAQEVHAREVAAFHVDLDRVRADGRAVAVRVRDAAAATSQLAGQVCSDTASAEVRQAAAHAARVLADVRERADARAGILAQAADNAHFAGRACEREFDAARKALMEN